jgi:hypothetical protein
MREVKDTPDVHEVGLWRGKVNLPDGAGPPFPDAAMKARCERCAVVIVRVDPRDDGLVRLDDATLAQIMPRGPTRQ